MGRPSLSLCYRPYGNFKWDSKSTSEWVLPWLVRWARRARTRFFCPALAALVAQYKIFLPSTYITVFQFICAHRPCSWLGIGTVAVVVDRLSRSMCVSGSLVDSHLKKIHSCTPTPSSLPTARSCHQLLQTEPDSIAWCFLFFSLFHAHLNRTE